MDIDNRYFCYMILYMSICKNKGIVSLFGYARIKNYNAQYILCIGNNSKYGMK